MSSKKQIIIIPLALFLLAVFPDCNFLFKKDEGIHIAMVLSVETGTGKSNIQGARLYVDKVNQAGGINGEKIILDIFDDNGTQEGARKIALEVVEKKQAVAVIGHVSSSLSEKGGEVYKQYEIPAITPSSTGDQVTLNNEWYFRTVFNNSTQGQFLVYYVENILQRDAVCILRESADYSSGISEVFKEEAGQHLDIKFDQVFDVKDEESYLEIIKELKRTVGKSAIFIGAHPQEGAKFVRLIRGAGIKNPIIGPTAFATLEFQKALEQFPKEKRTLHNHTDNLYVAVPFLFETANKMAQDFKNAYQEKYREMPDWQAAYAYDTAKVLLEAIRGGGVTGDRENLQEDRGKIRKYLSALTEENAVQGVTGLNYFDEHGDCPKPVSIGAYRNRHIVSALAQIRPVSDLSLIPDVKEAHRQNRIFNIGEKYLYRTDVVYTGIDINRVSDIDVDNASCLIDFYMWFRYHGQFDPQDVIFFNAVDPIELKKSSHSAAVDSVSLENSDFVRQEEIRGMTYLLYHVKARFRFLPYRPMGNFHTSGFSFRHTTLDHNNLIYVKDLLGTGRAGSDFSNHVKTSSIFRSEDWKVSKSLFFHDIFNESPKGDPRYIEKENAAIEYSRFNFEIFFKKESLSWRRKISEDISGYILICCLFFFAVLYVVKFRFMKTAKPIFFLQLIILCSLLLSTEVFLLKIVQAAGGTFEPKYIIRLFDILWWLAPAFFLHRGMEMFIWRPVEDRAGRPLPKVIRVIPSYLIYSISLYGIVVFVFRADINSLMATSGMVAMCVGFLVKSDVSNFFAGISITQGYKIKIGQWIEINGFDEGVVEEITKLATRIKTRDGAVLSIPNRVVLDSAICNHGYPDDDYWLELRLETVPLPRPERVMEVLRDAVLSAADGALTCVDPVVIFEGQGDSSAIYRVRFFVKDYGNKFVFLTSAWNSIWLSLEEAGIELATPNRIMHMREEPVLKSSS